MTHPGTWLGGLPSRTARLPPPRDILFAAGLICALALASCGTAPPSPGRAGPSFFSSRVTFTPTITYATALRDVTDLDTIPGLNCTAYQGGTGLREPWEPMGQRTAYARTHQLFVFQGGREMPTDWTARLANTGIVAGGVNGIQQAWPLYVGEYPTSAPTEVTYACPPGVPSADAASVPLVMSNADVDAAGAYARITFDGPLANYDAALALVSNLGLRLADPCLESKGYPIPSNEWRTAGQEVPFASTHTLVVGTVRAMTSTWWLRQLRTTPGVGSTTSPFQPTC